MVNQICQQNIIVVIFFVAFLANSADNVLWWSSSPGLVDGLAWNMYLIMFVYASV